MLFLLLPAAAQALLHATTLTKRTVSLGAVPGRNDDGLRATKPGVFHEENVEALLEQELEDLHVSHHATAPATPTFVYDFGAEKTDGDGSMKELLGGKGANLAAIAKLGLPCPPGFTITTEVCRYFYDHDFQYPGTLGREVEASLERLERVGGKKFGDSRNPLLVSVRSGARKSMPGMMDTVLNLGLNDATVRGLAESTGDPRFAWDCYRRFVAMYGDVVLGVKGDEVSGCPFDEIMEDLKKERRVTEDNDLSVNDLRDLVERYKTLIKKETKTDFPQDPYEQLWYAIGAVFGSWENDRARLYRQKYGIPSEWGTAVTVQTMVFGNKGDDSATGVAFTRNPATGENELYGEYLINAQGEDVVAGVRTPKPISQLADEMPESYRTLQNVRKILEANFHEMQDLEFTVEHGHFYLLQTRDGKRTGLAATRIAYEMVEDGILTSTKNAVERIPPDSIGSLLAPTFDPMALRKGKAVTSGLPAGPGAATGHVTFSATGAELLAKDGKKAVLCRVETTPDDLRGMLAAEGVLTTRGGVSSHAALVARQMGKVCVCGAGDVSIDYEKATMTLPGNIVFKEGDAISIDGTTGKVYKGVIPTAPSEVQQVLNGDLKAEDSKTYHMFDSILKWADEVRTLEIRANVDTPKQAELAVKLGAQGVGLCRTEHMFFEGDRLDLFRHVILAGGVDEEAERRAALAKLLPMQRQDFYGMLKALQGRPLTVRLLDPPLHEFTPHDTGSIANLAETLQVPFEKVNERCAALREANPMLGHRGCRLAISFPEVCEMQSRALFEAAKMAMNDGISVDLEIMVPFVGFKAELDHQVQLIKDTAESIDPNIPFKVGTMIELPRAALTAGEIAETAEFFSFGTNDLSQMTLGMSRDDSSSFLPTYLNHEVVHHNPFSTIDQTGVGQLVGIAVARGTQTRPDLHLGACGEHAGDPKSIEFFHNVGLHYVSCSAPRVPIARLAAAQAVLRNPTNNHHGPAKKTLFVNTPPASHSSK